MADEPTSFLTETYSWLLEHYKPIAWMWNPIAEPHLWWWLLRRCGKRRARSNHGYSHLSAPDSAYYPIDVSQKVNGRVGWQYRTLSLEFVPHWLPAPHIGFAGRHRANYPTPFCTGRSPERPFYRCMTMSNHLHSDYPCHPLHASVSGATCPWMPIRGQTKKYLWDIASHR